MASGGASKILAEKVSAKNEFPLPIVSVLCCCSCIVKKINDQNFLEALRFLFCHVS